MVQANIGIGIPGSGKTTYLKQLAANNHMVYVNADDIRQELTGDPGDHSRESMVWNLARERIKTALAAGTDVVIDATHSKARDRRHMVDFCRLHGAEKVEAYYIYTNIETSMARNAARQRQVPEDAIRTMARRLALHHPQLTEGYDNIEVIRT